MYATTLTPEDSSATASPSKRAISKSALEKPLRNYDAKGYPVLLPELVPSFQAQETGRLLEAQRLKERLSQHPLHGRRAKERGEKYWHDLANTYQGTL